SFPPETAPTTSFSRDSSWDRERTKIHRPKRAGCYRATRGETTKARASIDARPRRDLGCPAMAAVTLKGVSKSFGKTRVIENLDLEVRDQEFMVLVGPSGCGKSTALRMIAGLED